MSVKTTGLEFRKFYIDPAAWPDGVWHEDEVVSVDDIECDSDYDYASIPDSSLVVVSHGVVMNASNDDIGSFEGHFKKWRKKQTVIFMAAEIPKGKEEEFRVLVKSIGGKTA